MILLGINGRFFAVILSCLLAWRFISFEMQLSDAVMLVFVIWVMQLGTGKYSLWLWDDNWVNRYDGG
jgi:CDP-diacylglycerol--glycerol-3-phosphate 3-phosphatidyltransferase